MILQVSFLYLDRLLFKFTAILILEFYLQVFWFPIPALCYFQYIFFFFNFMHFYCFKF